MIPTDQFYEKFMNTLMDEDEDKELFQVKMEDLGFESTWLLPNLGSLLFFMGLFPLIIVLLAIISCIARFWNKCKQGQYNLSGFVFWNWPITYLTDSYVVIQICCLYNIQNQSWHNQAAQVNSGLSWSLFGLLLLYPALMQWYLYSKRAMLNHESFLHKYRKAYDGMDVNNNNFILYPLFFYYRRILVPLSVIFWPNVIFVQYGTLVMTGVATIILLGQKRPFASKSRVKSEIMQEITIIFISYHVFCFTDWLSDLEVRHWIGYSIIAWVMGQIFVTLAVAANRIIREKCKVLKRKK